MDEYKIDFSTPEYKGTLKEEKLEEAVDNEEVAGIIAKLRDNSFGNEDMRNELINLLTALKMYKDPSARKLFKDVGNALTNIGSSLLGDNESEYENDMEVEEVMDEPEMMDEPMKMDYEEDPYRGPLVIQRYEDKKMKRYESKVKESFMSDHESLIMNLVKPINDVQEITMDVKDALGDIRSMARKEKRQDIMKQVDKIWKKLPEVISLAGELVVLEKLIKL